MKKDNSSIFFLVIFICVLVSISAYFFITGETKWLKIYLAFLVVIWILTLGFWPWWGEKNKKNIQVSKENINSFEIDIEKPSNNWQLPSRQKHQPGHLSNVLLFLILIILTYALFTKKFDLFVNINTEPKSHPSTLVNKDKKHGVISENTNKIPHKNIKEANSENTKFSAGIDTHLNNYISAVYEKIYQYWNVPGMTDFDQDLEAIVLIKILEDGRVEELTFEKKSENNQFNNFVVHTIMLSTPLPKFPSGLKKDSYKIALHFKPAILP